MVEKQLAATQSISMNFEPDGNCFFRAVSFSRYGNQLKLAELQQATVSLMQFKLEK